MKKYLRRDKKIILAIFAIILLAAIILGIGAAQNNSDKQYIEHEFSKLTFPNSFSLQGRSWTKSSLDVTANWSYQFISNDDRNQTIEKLKSLFEKASCITPSYAGGDLDFICGKSKVNFLVYLNPMNWNAKTVTRDNYDALRNATPQRISMTGTIE